MKVLACHNYYQQRGGEDGSFEAECAMLEREGHHVVRFTRHNDDIQGMSQLSVAGKTLWNRDTVRELREIIRRERPHVMHCTNTFPLISPAAYKVAGDHGVPVVQSLRNYRILCPGSTLMRNGEVCEKCLHKRFAWPGVVHRCYRGSAKASAVVAAMTGVHWLAGTWTRRVTRYFALTEFSRRKFIEAGLPAERIALKPNFIDPDPGEGAGAGGYAIFVGRLAEEKGLRTLVDAWARLRTTVRLLIVGDGPMESFIAEAAQRDPRIVPMGRRTIPEVLDLVGDAAALVLPSLWFEGFPRTIVEAYSKGTPVIASNLGSMVELIDEGRTGAKFEPGNAAELAHRLQALLDHPERLAAMRAHARRAYVERYTAASNYATLMQIYDEAMSATPRRIAPPVVRLEPQKAPL